MSIEMGFGSKCNILSGQTVKMKNPNRKLPTYDLLVLKMFANHVSNFEMENLHNKNITLDNVNNVYGHWTVNDRAQINTHNFYL